MTIAEKILNNHGSAEALILCVTRAVHTIEASCSASGWLEYYFEDNSVLFLTHKGLIDES